jgi:hypothetical protein
MKSPACTQCRWGTGTTTDRIPDTDASKEMKARLAAVMAERTAQDCMWTAPPAQQQQEQPAASKSNAIPLNKNQLKLIPK